MVGWAYRLGVGRSAVCVYRVEPWLDGSTEDGENARTPAIFARGKRRCGASGMWWIGMRSMPRVEIWGGVHVS